MPDPGLATDPSRALACGFIIELLAPAVSCSGEDCLSLRPFTPLLLPASIPSPQGGVISLI